MTVTELNGKFPTEASIADYCVKIIYDNNLTCPYCGSSKHISRNSNNAKRAQCNKCNKTFSIFKGTIFEKSRTKLKTWFYAINLFLNAKKGISSCQLKRETGVSKKCAFKMLSLIRKAAGNIINFKTFSGIVEVDETYIGRKSQKKYIYDTCTRKYKLVLNKRGRGTSKIPVVGIFERNLNRVYAKVMFPDKKGQLLNGTKLLSVINSACGKDVIIMTDEFRGYNILDKLKYKHFSVNHSKGQYSDKKGVHVNNIENFWNILKKGYYGTYHHVRPEHLQGYIDEFCFRRNHSRNPFIFDSFLKQILISDNKNKNI